MKAVLISIQPKWCELIASRRKTIEVRKTRPKIETPFKCYIYATKPKTYSHPARIYNSFIMPESGECGSGKVIGEFVCDDIIVDERGENADVFSKYAQLSLVEQKKYGANKPLFGWHITDLKIYYKPKELWEFSSYGCKIVGDCCINYDCPNCIDNGWMQPPDCKIDGCYLTRPPQSWCYVEELE